MKCIHAVKHPTSLWLPRDMPTSGPGAQGSELQAQVGQVSSGIPVPSCPVHSHKGPFRGMVSGKLLCSHSWPWVTTVLISLPDLERYLSKTDSLSPGATHLPGVWGAPVRPGFCLLVYRGGGVNRGKNGSSRGAEKVWEKEWSRLEWGKGRNWA